MRSETHLTCSLAPNAREAKMSPICRLYSALIRERSASSSSVMAPDRMLMSSSGISVRLAEVKAKDTSPCCRFERKSVSNLKGSHRALTAFARACRYIHSLPARCRTSTATPACEASSDADSDIPLPKCR